MIECLHELATSAGVQRINISIQAASNQKVGVVIQSILGAAPQNLTEEQNALREALAMPISIEGLAGEVEAKLDSLLSDHVASVKPHADSLEVQLEKSKANVKKACNKDSAGSSESDDSTKEVTENVSDQESDFSSDDAESL